MALNTPRSRCTSPRCMYMLLLSLHQLSRRGTRKFTLCPRFPTQAKKRVLYTYSNYDNLISPIELTAKAKMSSAEEMRYFSTRGGKETLSFEEVTLPVLSRLR